MAEYIELGTAIALIREQGIYGEGHSDEERENDVISMLESIPAADVAEVVHGRWEPCGFGKEIMCSVCRCELGDVWEYRHCPNCGARMDGE